MSLTPAINFSPVSLTPLNSFAPVSLTPVININSRISPRIFEKFKTAPMEYLGAWGTLIHEKKLRSKISCQTPFNLFTLSILSKYVEPLHPKRDQNQRGRCILFSVVSSLPISIFTPPHPSHLGLLPVISLLLANTLPWVRACLSIGLERFCVNQKEDERGPRSIDSGIPKTVQ